MLISNCISALKKNVKKWKITRPPTNVKVLKLENAEAIEVLYVKLPTVDGTTYAND